jgi:prolipoprotein diacylglyceryltransferase
MKRIETFIVTASLFPVFALAQVPKVTNPISAVSTFPQFLDMLLSIFQLLITPVLVVAIIWAGFLFVTAQGDEKKITLAKSVLLWTIVAAAIILGARVIYDMVSGTVTPFILMV